MNRVKPSEICIGKTTIPIRYVEAEQLYLRVADRWERVDCILDIREHQFTLPTPADPERAEACFQTAYNMALRDFGPKGKRRKNKKK